MAEDCETAKSSFDFVRFTYVDIHGIGRGKTISSSAFDKLFRTGIRAYVGSIGFGLNGELEPGNAVNKSQKDANHEPHGNLTAHPIAGTLHSLPYVSCDKYRVGEIMCETFHSATGERQMELPRYIARRQLDRLRSKGYELYSSFELEFMLVDPKSLVPVFTNCGEMFANFNMNEFGPILMEAASQLEDMGIEVETLQSEYSEGQFELVLKPQLGIKIADNVIISRDCIKEVAKKHGLKAIFMTKLGAQAVCNSLHFNHSIRRTGGTDSEFAHVNGTHKLSDLCRSWIGGLIRHYRAINAISSPTFNCYRRVNKPWAPQIANWGIDNRMTSFRVNNYTADMTYIESRLPGGGCNPYLILAAMVSSGIDGIENQLPCPPPSPAKGIPEKCYTETERAKVPTTIEEGLASLNDDLYMVDALGSDFVRWFTLLKKTEITSLNGCDVDKNDQEMFSREQKLYMDML